MRSFKDIPIQRKLTLVIMLISMVVLFSASAAFIAFDVITFRQTLARNMAAMAQIVGANSTAALTFDVPDDARKLLGTLRVERHVRAAAIYDQDGNLFARYPSDADSERAELPESPGRDGVQFRPDYLSLTQPIVLDNARIGTIYLTLDAAQIRQRIWLQSWIVAGVLSASSLLAFALSRLLQRQISRSVLELASAAKAVSERKDYTVRAAKFGDDELGHLTQTFNDMLARIDDLNTELEERVMQRTAELAASNRELEAFTYSVSHDLRAPLRHITAFGEVLKEDYASQLPEDAAAYIDRISESTRNMSAMVDALLNLARLGRREINRSRTDLTELVTQTIADLAEEAAGRDIQWKTSPLPLVECDPSLVKQVFTNLLANATKYTRPRQQAVIEIGATTRDATPVIFVRDNGVGFDMRFASRLFGVFQRLHRQEEFEGTGVGLATVERIIHKHGGRIWPESTPGEGATFYFTLGPGAEPEETSGHGEAGGVPPPRG